MSWRKRAACRNRPDITEWFFATPSEPEYREAEKLCAQCPVVSECTQEGARRGEWGRWGTYAKLVRHATTVRIHCETCRTELVAVGRTWVCPTCRARQDRDEADRERVRRVRRGWWRPEVTERTLEGLPFNEAVAVFEAWISDSESEYRAG